jgi:hypothetical protein
MKALILALVAAFGLSAFAAEYKCSSEACGREDCITYFYYLLVQNGQMKLWMETEPLRKKGDPSDVRNVSEDDIKVGPLKRTRNGKYQATGDGLNPKGAIPIENLVKRTMTLDAALVEGGKSGKVVETDLVHHAKNPNKILKPRVMDYKCDLIKE